MSASVPFAAVVLAGVGACYSGPINMAPSIEVVSTDPLKRNSDIGFRAEVSDPDNGNGTLTVVWSHFEGDCSQPPPVLPASAMGPEYTVPGPDTAGDFCLRATVTDPYGATDEDQRTYHPDNQAPSIQLLVEGEDIRSGGWKQQEPFSVFRWIRFDATATTDPDDDEASLSFDWSSLPPAPPLTDCPNNGETSGRSICAKPTQPGPLMVELTVRDRMGEAMTVTRTVIVAGDDFPCLAHTMPNLAATMVSSAPEQDQDFRVLEVVDDGDPYPATPGNPDQTTFRWFLARADGPFERQDGNGAYFTVPGGRFFLGEQVRVRVEIVDRNLKRSELELEPCKDDICATGPACRQRMTWLIDYRQ